MQAITSDFLECKEVLILWRLERKKKKTQTQQQQINNTCENVNELLYLTMNAV